MMEQLTPANVARVREVLTRTTPLPWRVEGDDVCAKDDEVYVRGYSPLNYVALDVRHSSGDAEFIVLARELLPLALDELDRSRARERMRCRRCWRGDTGSTAGADTKWRTTVTLRGFFESWPTPTRGLMRHTICVDFDGVLHAYTTPWVAPHVIPDGPVEGAMEWLRAIVGHFDVVILSTRCRTWRGRRAIRRWLWRHDTGGVGSFAAWEDTEQLGSIRCSYRKVPALIYLDDRAVRFTGPGTFPTKREIHRLRPWNKGG